MKGICLCAVVAVACSKGGSGDVAQAAGSPGATQARVDAAPPSLGDRLGAAKDLAGVLEIVLPLIEDVDDGESSTGAIALAATIGARHDLGTWRIDVLAVAKNETSYKLVMKDPDAQRGKRMCVRGKIVQMAKRDFADTVLWEGLMTSGGLGTIVHYIAAGSSGELGDNDWARLCGVVTGRFSYDNAGGGRTHAIEVVGMFDLPENRRGAGE